MGFGGEITNSLNKQNSYDMLKHVEPDDLRSYGFIPEFIGRLPVLVFELLRKMRLSAYSRSLRMRL